MAGTGNNMKNMTAFHITWILVGCIFAEAAFMIVQIALTIACSGQSVSLHDMLSPDNPLYAIPPHFLIVGVVFLAAIIFGEYKQIYNIGYYIVAAVIAAILYFISLWLSNFTLLFKDIVINLVAAVISGAIYWAITPRRYNRRSLSTFN